MSESLITLSRRIGLGAVVFALAIAMPAQAAFQTFDNAASTAAGGWTGLRNQDVGLGTNYGFSNTNNTTAPSGNGEAGGVMPDRTPQINYYADTANVSYNDTVPFRATGWMRLSAIPVNGFFELGFFKHDDPNRSIQGYSQFVGMRFSDNPHVSARFMTAGGNFFNIAPADVNIPWKFLINYEPVWAVNPAFAMLTVELRRSNDTLIGSTMTGGLIGNFSFNMNAFGLVGSESVTAPSSSMNVFIDDVMTVPEPAVGGIILAGVLCLARRGRRCS